jgi:hypothetical protein
VTTYITQGLVFGESQSGDDAVDGPRRSAFARQHHEFRIKIWKVLIFPCGAKSSRLAVGAIIQFIGGCIPFPIYGVSDHR